MFDRLLKELKEGVQELPLQTASVGGRCPRLLRAVLGHVLQQQQAFVNMPPVLALVLQPARQHAHYLAVVLDVVCRTSDLCGHKRCVQSNQRPQAGLASHTLPTNPPVAP